ncbi:GTP 3',8-cyclase MoaA [Magnetospira sp. QH-2]|uniref:GTP 3',8-cyclase MoaA n=1 Tax=Magnetospira sp. (strain QH-2) TaxID=1288970 RepID=UPI0003E8188C|nr:GTP 3',8-cyclase MoaA [Magnetospira sp. QH-2]CCQ74087.1 Molybdenum cofactor biosynthesis protein A [Magnetospira sp. QH-2]
MQDAYQRAITYLRVSVTDRCDLRCRYCMAEDMTFRPRDELLSLEELDRLCSAFVGRGVRKLRITGGEPLVRRNIIHLFRRLSRHLEAGSLDELTLTTNGSQLAHHARDLMDCGVRRVNVSLDTLDPAEFADLTRFGDLKKVLYGIDTARKAGLKIKINAVAQRGLTERSADRMVEWCGDQGFDLTFIETMPMGDIGGTRQDSYLPLSALRTQLDRRWTLTPSDHATGGPSRYMDVAETGQRIGFITPLSDHFCESCNRVRLTCTGTLYMCLGQDDAADLRGPLRDHPSEDGPLLQAIDDAIARKPKGHEFLIDDTHGDPALTRHMSVTGG